MSWIYGTILIKIHGLIIVDVMFYSTYKVYGHSDITNKFDKRIYSDHLCIREDVYAWKRMPKLCKRYPRDNFGYISDKLDGQEAFNILKTHFLGSDYYVTESICDNEVNAIIVKRNIK